MVVSDEEKYYENLGCLGAVLCFGLIQDECIDNNNFAYNDYGMSIATKAILPYDAIKNGQELTTEYKSLFLAGFIKTFKHCLSIKPLLLEWANRATLPKDLKRHIELMDESFLDFNIKLIEQSFEDCFVEEPGIKEILFDGQDINKRIDDLFIKLKDHFIKTPSGDRILLEQTDKNPIALTKKIGANGKLGIALFFKAYAFHNQNTPFSDEASQLASQLIAEVDYAILHPDEDMQLGDCEGISGILKCALLINYFDKDPAVNLLIAHTCDTVSSLDFEKRLFCDKYSGLAGLLSVYCRFEELPQREEIIEKLADRIINLKNLEYNGTFLWDTILIKRPISGAAHGMMGIFQALYGAYRITGKKKYEEAALDAWKFENDIYSEELGTWPDLRTNEEPVDVMCGFCVGAPGIGSTLLSLYDFRDDIPNYEMNLSRAVDSCMKQKIKYRDHICCGNASIADFMVDLYTKTGEEEFLDRAKELLLTEYNYAFLQSKYKNTFINSLYFGAAGVGYELLRIIDSTSFLSFLV